MIIPGNFNGRKSNPSPGSSLAREINVKSIQTALKTLEASVPCAPIQPVAARELVNFSATGKIETIKPMVNDFAAYVKGEGNFVPIIVKIKKKDEIRLKATISSPLTSISRNNVRTFFLNFLFSTNEKGLRKAIAEEALVNTNSK